MPQTIEDVITAGQRSPGSTLLFEGVRRNPKLPYKGDVSCVPIFATLTGGSYLGALVASNRLITCGNKLPQGEISFLGGEWASTSDYEPSFVCDGLGERLGVTAVILNRGIIKCKPVRLAQPEWYQNQKPRRAMMITAHRSIVLGLACPWDSDTVRFLKDPKNLKWWREPSPELDSGSPIFTLGPDGELTLITVIGSDPWGPPLGRIL